MDIYVLVSCWKHRFLCMSLCLKEYCLSYLMTVWGLPKQTSLSLSLRETISVKYDLGRFVSGVKKLVVEIGFRLILKLFLRFTQIVQTCLSQIVSSCIGLCNVIWMRCRLCLKKIQGCVLWVLFFSRKGVCLIAIITSTPIPLPNLILIISSIENIEPMILVESNVPTSSIDLANDFVLCRWFTSTLFLQLLVRPHLLVTSQAYKCYLEQDSGYHYSPDYWSLDSNSQHSVA